MGEIYIYIYISIIYAITELIFFKLFFYFIFHTRKTDRKVERQRKNGCPLGAEWAGEAFAGEAAAQEEREKLKLLLLRQKELPIGSQQFPKF